MNVDMGTAGSLEDIVTATSLDLESSQFMREPAVKNPPAAAKHPDADLKHSVATAVALTPSAPLPAPPAVPTNGSEVAQTSDAARKSGTQTGRRRVEVRFIEDKCVCCRQIVCCKCALLPVHSLRMEVRVVSDAIFMCNRVAISDRRAGHEDR